jgi:hypothetical protein
VIEEGHAKHAIFFVVSSIVAAARRRRKLLASPSPGKAGEQILQRTVVAHAVLPGMLILELRRISVRRFSSMLYFSNAT